MDNAPLFENLRKLVTVVDELRDVGLQQFINLPRIVVLGTQSAGKSSLLESIVGIDFLPRGEGVVTRRPLELRLVHIADPTGETKPWGIFDQDKNTKYTDFNKVREKIQELTDKIAGKNKGIIDDPIILNVYSPSCPDLTLIDLPGITRIPLANSDQSKDIEKVTKEMATRYCQDKRTIILCVVPANADISTSDALQMARDHLDPNGDRTIGVLTKLDIMDRGTNAKKMIYGEEVPLKLGYVGVKGRSQHDINQSLKVDSALEQERKWFAEHPVYSTFPPGYLGHDTLVQKLTRVFFQHIKKILPEIIKDINSRARDCENRLKDLGPPLPREQTEKMQLLWNMITDFTEYFKNSIKGKYDSRRVNVINKEIPGGAQIKLMFSDLYKEFVKPNYKATKDYSDRDIEKAIILHQGDSIPGFPSIDSFLYLIQPQLDKLQEPAIECLNDVYNFLEGLALKIVNKVFARFPQIIDEVGETVVKVLQKERNKARELVEDILESELNYLFTNDSEYLLSRSQIIPNGQKEVDPHTQFIQEMRNRVDTYFNVVVRSLRDSIPKSIGYFFVRRSEEKMQFELYNEINGNMEIMALMSEPSHIAAERDTLNRTLNILRKAQKVLKKDPDMAAAIRADEEESSSKVESDSPERRQEKKKIIENIEEKIEKTEKAAAAVKTEIKKADTNSSSDLFGNAGKTQPPKKSTLFG